MPDPKASTLVDDFPTATLGAWWTQLGGGTVTGANPGAVFPSDGSFTSYRIDTASTYDLTGSSVTLQWSQLNDRDGDVFFIIGQGGFPYFEASLFYQPSLATVSGWSPGNPIPFTATIQGGGGWATFASAQITPASPTATPKWWRIRCESGVPRLHIEYSADGISYTVLLSQTLGMPPDSVTVEIAGGQGNTSADSILRHYNFAPLCDETWLSSDLILPSEDFESYAGSDVALNVVYDAFGTILDNTPGDPHAGDWCGQFTTAGTSPTLVYPKGAWDGGGSSIKDEIFDVSFWIAHDDISIPANGPAFALEKQVWFLIRGDNSDTVNAPTFVIPVGGWNCGITGFSGTRYSTPAGTLPGDGVYRKVRVHLELDRNGLHAAGAGVVQIWIDDVLQLNETSASLSQLVFTAYVGTYGGVVIQNGGSTGFTSFRLDDINLCTMIIVAAARARQWEIM